jgi:hypothetical protein
MYNLTVDEAHTFFVGEGQWLLHNTDPLCGIRLNAANGAAAEARALADLRAAGYEILAAGGDDVGRITLNIPGQGKRVIDVLARDANGNLVAIEVKSGQATYLGRQAAKDAQISVGNYTLPATGNWQDLPREVRDALQNGAPIPTTGMKR